MSSYPLSLEFNIFYKNTDLDIHQLRITYELKHMIPTNNNILDCILKDSVNKLGNKYKFVEENGSFITSFDETKRLSLDGSKKVMKHSIYFKQSGRNYFTVDELAEISSVMKLEFEKYLKFQIFEPIIFIETDKLKSAGTQLKKTNRLITIGVVNRLL